MVTFTLSLSWTSCSLITMQQVMFTQLRVGHLNIFELWIPKSDGGDGTSMVSSDPLIPKHGGYRKLKSFQVAQLVYDLTVRFCDRYVEKRSRTRDQMVQAARSGVQNIAEGSQASGTSKKSELKLTNVARASLEELRLDYEDFLRQRGLAVWTREDPRRQRLVDRRCKTADAVAVWVGEEFEGGRCGRGGQGGREATTYPELAANAALVLLAVACSPRDRQLATLATAFESEGDFTERLHWVRTQKGAVKVSMSTPSTRSTSFTRAIAP